MKRAAARSRSTILPELRGLRRVPRSGMRMYVKLGDNPIQEMKKYIFIVLLLFVSSCSIFEQKETANNFPFVQSWKMEVGEDIYALAVADCQVAVAGSSTLLVIDANTGRQTWSKKIYVDPESPLIYANGSLIAAGYGKIGVYDKSGQEIAGIDIDPSKGSARVASAFSHYIFVTRTPAWVLEVYDAEIERLVWTMNINRGGIDIHYNDSTNTVYVTSLGGIQAINIADGYLIWETLSRVSTSTYNNDVIYYVGDDKAGDTIYISAIDVDSHQQIWTTELAGERNQEIYSLTVLDNVLVAATQYGLLAYDKTTGSKLWQSESEDQFYSPPVKIDDLYAKGSMSGRIYSISPGNGRTMGDLQLGKLSLPIQPYFEYKAGIYSCENALIFSTTDTVFAYKKVDEVASPGVTNETITKYYFAGLTRIATCAAQWYAHVHGSTADASEIPGFDRLNASLNYRPFTCDKLFVNLNRSRHPI